MSSQSYSVYSGHFQNARGLETYQQTATGFVYVVSIPDANGLKTDQFVVYRASGTDLTYNGEGDLVGGTVTSVALEFGEIVEEPDGSITVLTESRSDANNPVISISGLNADPETFMNVAIDTSENRSLRLDALSFETTGINASRFAEASEELIFNVGGNVGIGVNSDATDALVMGSATSDKILVSNYSNAQDSSAEVFGYDGDDEITVLGGLTASIHGGDGDDRINAFSNSEHYVNGGSGNDTIRSSGGDGRLLGGSGNDDIDGGSGDDELFGGTGEDWLKGGRGDDKLFGGAGEDLLEGERGNDELRGGWGDDELDGGDGDDLLAGNLGNDQMDGGDGSDRMWGGQGNDRLEGGDGDDLVNGNDGDDIAYGQAGADRVNGGNGDDYLSGGDGNDTVRGGSGSDELSGDAGDDRLFGGTGDDSLNGGDGADRLDGNGGDDVLTGGSGADVFVLARGGSDADIITDFEIGIDTLQIGGRVYDDDSLDTFVQDNGVQTDAGVRLAIDSDSDVLLQGTTLEDFGF